MNNIMSNYNSKINIDNLFPEGNKSGTRCSKLDIDTLFSGTSINNEPEITFSSDMLLNKIKKRRIEKLKCYRQMLKYCHERINSADDNLETDIIFTVLEQIPDCKDYNPHECLEYISIKLRDESIDTTILTNTTMFITWKYLELKKENEKNKVKLND